MPVHLINLSVYLLPMAVLTLISISLVKHALIILIGIVKTYNLTYMEAEPLRCLLTQSSCAHHMKADAKYV